MQSGEFEILSSSLKKSWALIDWLILVLIESGTLDRQGVLAALSGVIGDDPVDGDLGVDMIMTLKSQILDAI